MSERADFLKDLPPLRASEMKGPNRLCLTKEQRLEIEIYKASQRIEADK
jgi:hypothetical protein